MNRILDTPYVHFDLQDGLLIGTYKKNPRLTLDIAKEVVKTRLEFTGPEPVLALIYNEGVKKLDKDARDYLASDEGIKGIIAAAYVLDNPFSSFLANFYVSISKSKLPIRIFSKKAAALKWLQQFKK